MNFSWLKHWVSNTRLDAILVGLAGAATFVWSAVWSALHDPTGWHPQSYGIGFGAMATGLGLLFRLRQKPPSGGDE